MPGIRRQGLNRSAKTEAWAAPLWLRPIFVCIIYHNIHCAQSKKQVGRKAARGLDALRLALGLAQFLLAALQSVSLRFLGLRPNPTHSAAVLCGLRLIAAPISKGTHLHLGIGRTHVAGIGTGRSRSEVPAH